jgi:hypothetical protein
MSFGIQACMAVSRCIDIASSRALTCPPLPPE